MGQKFRKHGIRASHTAEVVLSDVRVPGRCVVGGRERLEERLARVREGGHGGEQAAMKTFEASRPGVAAMAVGVARAAVEYAAEYSRTRVQFGRPIGQNQGVAFMLTDLEAEISEQDEWIEIRGFRSMIEYRRFSDWLDGQLSHGVIADIPGTSQTPDD
jgi:alkylation response protein AidB-like acyl-CoA dehydrogenase